MARQAEGQQRIHKRATLTRSGVEKLETALTKFSISIWKIKEIEIHIQQNTKDGLSENTIRKIVKQEPTKIGTLEKFFSIFNLSLEEKDYAFYQIENYKAEPSGILQEPTSPDEPLPYGSPFYIHPIEIHEQAIREITISQSLIVIKGALKRGRTSFINHLVNDSRLTNYKTIRINIRDDIDESDISNLNTLFRSICFYLGRRLNLKCRVEDLFSEGSAKQNLQYFFEDYVIHETNEKILIIFDNVEYLFNSPLIRSEFSTVVRSLHQNTKASRDWNRLSFAIAHSTAEYLSTNVDISPFNSTTDLYLPCFNTEDIQTLIGLYNIQPSQIQSVDKLIDFTGGEPYLIQKALFYLHKNTSMTLSEIIKFAHTLDQGIYSNHLRAISKYIEPALVNPHSRIFIKGLLKGENECQKIDEHLPYLLQRLGVIKRSKASGYSISCELYHKFLSTKIDVSIWKRIWKFPGENHA